MGQLFNFDCLTLIFIIGRIIPAGMGFIKDLGYFLNLDNMRYLRVVFTSEAVAVTWSC